VLFFTELTSRFVYAKRVNASNSRSLSIEILNCFKIGIIYSLFLEAFKLGS